MPSGSKKRKAAKKKKEINPNPSSSSPRAHGDGDGDGKDSDVSSPASLDRHNPHNAFSGEEESEGENNTTVEEPREVSVVDSDRKNGKSENDGSSRDSSSSSDEETSFEEMKYRRSENENTPELPEGVSKTEVDISSQDDNKKARSVHFVDELKENEEKLITPHVDDRLTASNNVPIASGDDHERDSGVSEPFLGSVQRREQTASWKSCCGLLDVFTGSGR